MKEVCWPNCRVASNEFHLHNQLQSTVRDVSVSPLPSVQSDSIMRYPHYLQENVGQWLLEL